LKNAKTDRITSPEQSFSELTTTTVTVLENKSPLDKPVIMLRRIGNTTFQIAVHFSQTSKETVSDKIARMIQNDIAAERLVV
jgi:hypothetical protein